MKAKLWLIGWLSLCVLAIYVIIPSRERFTSRMQKIFDDLEYRKWQQKQSQRQQYQLHSILRTKGSNAANYQPRKGNNPFQAMQNGTMSPRSIQQQLARNRSMRNAWGTFNQSYNPTFNKDMALTETDRELDAIIHSRPGSPSRPSGSSWRPSGSPSRPSGSPSRTSGSSWRQPTSSRSAASASRRWGSSSYGTSRNQTNRQGNMPRRLQSNRTSSINPSASTYRSSWSANQPNQSWDNRLTQGDKLLDSVIQSAERT